MSPSPQLLVLLLLAVLLLFPLYLLIFSTKRALSKKIKLPPSPPKFPLIGNILQLGSLSHHSLRALAEKHGPLMLLHLGRVPTLVVSSAEIAQEIMRTQDLVFASRPSLKAIRIAFYEGMGLAFTPYGDYWRLVRKLCALHVLGAQKVHSFRLMREEEVAFMMEKISEASAALVPVDMSKVLNSFANDMISRAVAGKFFRGGGRNDLLRELIDEMPAIAGQFHFEDYFPSLAWLDALLGLNTGAQRLFKRWDGVLSEVIKDHGDRMKDGRHENNLVDLLMSLQEDSNNQSDLPKERSLTKEQIKGILSDMFSAGTETSYAVLEWAMVEIVRNPEVMKKLQDEVRGIANGKGLVREEELSAMSYLKAVVKELLRLHPPVPLLLPRESMDDCQIQGYQVPKKTRVLINAWAIGRDSKYWEAPEEFRPERFLSNTVDFRGNDFQFIPFGAGRRICPGMNFAVATLELALANLVLRFNWELPSGMTREEMDMAEAPGLTSRRKERLHLVAKSCI
ncbi:cytochrome P450 71A1-like [Phoenix dactylifera]|nr:cytochrome P450 71A1-like [Phoenix dactylifera]